MPQRAVLETLALSRPGIRPDPWRTPQQHRWRTRSQRTTRAIWLPYWRQGEAGTNHAERPPKAVPWDVLLMIRPRQ